MRTSITTLFLVCLSISLSAQTSLQSSHALLPMIGKCLNDNRIPATHVAQETGDWNWKFILAEDHLKRKVSPILAKQLTSFVFSYNQRTHTRKGDVLQAREGIDKHQTLEMIYQQLQRNVTMYGKELDILNINGELYYLLYFPSEVKKS